jgi:BirA family transcriptional regulator, biotin operon repressor / biotin---[acetyl-CoA-carboxylase] ligase
VDSFSGYLADLERSQPANAGLRPENLVAVCCISSTNHLAREIVAEYEREAQALQPTLVLAYEQSGGRGRQGRSWSSPPGKGIYATRVLATGDIDDLQTLPLLVGVGLCRGLAAHLPVPVRLKWPNDLVVETAEGRRKIGGILIEALVRPGEGAAALIGFGVNHGHLAADLPANATSGQLLGTQASLTAWTWDLVAALETELRHLGDTDYAVAAYRENSVHQAGELIAARVGDGVAEGRFIGFDERGRLLLDRDGEELRLTAGEVIE